jgi:hypothetical protein
MLRSLEIIHLRDADVQLRATGHLYYELDVCHSQTSSLQQSQMSSLREAGHLRWTRCRLDVSKNHFSSWTSACCRLDVCENSFLQTRRLYCADSTSATKGKKTACQTRRLRWYSWTSANRRCPVCITQPSNLQGQMSSLPSARPKFKRELQTRHLR